MVHACGILSSGTSKGGSSAALAPAIVPDLARDRPRSSLLKSGLPRLREDERLPSGRRGTRGDATRRGISPPPPPPPPPPPSPSPSPSPRDGNVRVELVGICDRARRGCVGSPSGIRAERASVRSAPYCVSRESIRAFSVRSAPHAASSVVIQSPMPAAGTSDTLLLSLTVDGASGSVCSEPIGSWPISCRAYEAHGSSGRRMSVCRPGAAGCEAERAAGGRRRRSASASAAASAAAFASIIRERFVTRCGRGSSCRSRAEAEAEADAEAETEAEGG